MTKHLGVFVLILIMISCEKNEIQDPSSGLDLPINVIFTDLPTDLNSMLELGQIFFFKRVMVV